MNIRIRVNGDGGSGDDLAAVGADAVAHEEIASADGVLEMQAEDGIRDLM